MLHLSHCWTDSCMQCQTRWKRKNPFYSRSWSLIWQSFMRHPSVQMTRGARNVRKLHPHCVYDFAVSMYKDKSIPKKLCPEFVSRWCHLHPLICRWRPTHSGETKDEDDEPLFADAECRTAQRESSEEPGWGRTAGAGGQRFGQAGEETVEKQTWSSKWHQSVLLSQRLKCSILISSAFIK